ncbi:hypothetical protein TREES_T100011701 [Tupaia chinensis]|uniref:Uncharacterized protein n=1 Tax=Tupaia chinensis TaxID=246437 RepID=L9L119_TUPCH|nr:hypothetical protein TREES_T100011701 [Tupaia chinensis]
MLGAYDGCRDTGEQLLQMSRSSVCFSVGSSELPIISSSTSMLGAYDGCRDTGEQLLQMSRSSVCFSVGSSELPSIDRKPKIGLRQPLLVHLMVCTFGYTNISRASSVLVTGQVSVVETLLTDPPHSTRCLAQVGYLVHPSQYQHAVMV